jgi:perosamine synthetase
MQRPAQLDDGDWQWVQQLVPADEPPLLPCTSGPRCGRVYSVAETRFVGNEQRYLEQCIASNWVSSKGPFIEKFERAFAPEAGCEFAVTCSSGTVALHLVLAALGLGPDDEVIVPAFTMIAVANTVRYTGAAVRLVDVEPATCNLDPALVEAAITPRTRAIVAVHTYGHPAAMDQLRDIARAHDLDLIEDAAEAHGAELAGKRVGGLGLAGTFSFYANKIITTGEGGMVTTNDQQLAAMVRRLRDHAFHPKRHFWHEHVGFNYRMTNLQAAVGLAQTERMDSIVTARRRLREWYQERLEAIPGLQLPVELEDARSVFWMYGIRVAPAFGCGSDELRSRLARSGIETRSFFIPIHLQPIYFDQFRGQRFPVAEQLCKSGFYLPTHENLQEGDVDWICAQMRDIHAQVSAHPARADECYARPQIR